MGKGLALFGLILIIVGLLPVILAILGITTPLMDYFFMLGLYEITLAGYNFSELMLILIVLGVIFLIAGAVR